MAIKNKEYVLISSSRRPDCLGALLKFLAACIACLLLIAIVRNKQTVQPYSPRFYQSDSSKVQVPGLTRRTSNNTHKPTIVVVTPTMQRPERLADLTMLSQTLKQVENIYWIVVEDGYYPKAIVKDLLDRSGIEYTYLATPHLGLPCRGWAQRNLALAFLRKNKNKFNKNDIIYFADDDNGYDLRLFDEYIRNVRKAGVWAVGIPGNALIEAPLVENGKVVAWHSAYKPERKFAIDMAGFALNFKLVTNSSAAWSLKCAGNFPENCFLNQLNLEREDLEPFGYESETKPVYVWHRKTAPANNEPFDLMGYQVEDRLPTNKQCKMYKNIHLMSYQQVKNVANKFGVKEYDYNELYGDV